jgi:uncharacterized membrane protein YecN with MAPEG domain
MTTALYAALAVLMLIALSVNVIRGRRQFRAALGDSGDLEMTRRIRAQANFTEYTPLFLLTLGLAEHGGLPVWAVHLFGTAFLSGRAMHAFSLLRGEQYEGRRLLANPAWRVRGMALTLSILAGLSILVLIQWIGGALV